MRRRRSGATSNWPDPTVTTVVDVLLEPRDNEQTLMTIEHAFLPHGLLEQHTRGWTAIAEQLAEQLASRPTQRLAATAPCRPEPPPQQPPGA